VSDTYKGETLGKKIARAWFWIVVREYLGERFLTGHHLVLASREGGDVGVLKAMGVRPELIIAAEINKKAADEFSSKHPDVKTFNADVNTAASAPGLRKSVVCAHLDFCSWYTPRVRATAIRVARFAVAERGVLSIGVMKGREQGALRDELSLATARMQKFIKHQCRRDRFTGDDFEASKRALLRSATTIARENFIRSDLRRGLEDGPSVSLVSLCSIGYDSGRTPMLHSVHVVRRHFSRRKLEKICATWEQEVRGAQEATARDTADFINVDNHTVPNGSWEMGEGGPLKAVQMAALCERRGLDAAGILNVRPSRLAAWRAHATRGSYAKTG
jgi:hypothetical protein